ncbi:hypothetical protein CEXT_21401 [Caerostris extrusa]|uniref:Uncharacterized protein n=1 Tax=Caerostris extrusa TaxID=172846 RepID=A0AAV4Q539_CAEEX|nr:hypothetical protein CEXT_21401 [Caerostris extrusa]
MSLTPLLLNHSELDILVMVTNPFNYKSGYSKIPLNGEEGSLEITINSSCLPHQKYTLYLCNFFPMLLIIVMVVLREWLSYWNDGLLLCKVLLGHPP